MDKQIIFFDYDGVIVNTFDTAYKTAHDIDHSIKKDEYRSWFEENAHKSIAKREGDNKDKFIREFFKRFNKKIKKKGVNEKVADEIKKLAEDYILIIVSSTGSKVIKEQLEQEDLAKYFYEFLGYDVHTSKSKKISDTLKVYNTKNQDSLLITDTLGDIREANRVEVKTIGVTWGYHDKKTLSKGSPDYIITQPKKITPTIKNTLNS